MKNSTFLTTMFIILGIILIILILSCKVDKKDQLQTISSEEIYSEPPTVIIDNCEYLKLGGIGVNYYTLIHKGNCNNPIHQYK